MSPPRKLLPAPVTSRTLSCSPENQKAGTQLRPASGCEGWRPTSEPSAPQRRTTDEVTGRSGQTRI